MSKQKILSVGAIKYYSFTRHSSLNDCCVCNKKKGIFVINAGVKNSFSFCSLDCILRAYKINDFLKNYEGAKTVIKKAIKGIKSKCLIKGTHDRYDDIAKITVNTKRLSYYCNALKDDLFFLFKSKILAHTISKNLFYIYSRFPVQSAYIATFLNCQGCNVYKMDFNIFDFFTFFDKNTLQFKFLCNKCKAKNKEVLNIDRNYYKNIVCALLGRKMFIESKELLKKIEIFLKKHKVVYSIEKVKGFYIVRQELGKTDFLDYK